MKYANPVTIFSTKVKSKKQLTIRLNRTWLLNATKLNSDDVQILINDLRSTKSNDELQNDLFEWLGFDKFDVIETILKNRSDIIEKVNIEDRKNVVREKVLSTSNPLVSQNCIVQSKEEKSLMKAIRKDDKKLMKEQNNNKDTDVDDVDDNDINVKLAIILKITQEQEEEFSNFARNKTMSRK